MQRADNAGSAFKHIERGTEVAVLKKSHISKVHANEEGKYVQCDVESICCKCDNRSIASMQRFDNAYSATTTLEDDASEPIMVGGFAEEHRLRSLDGNQWLDDEAIDACALSSIGYGRPTV
jgi:hypothetical protein